MPFRSAVSGIPVADLLQDGSGGIGTFKTTVRIAVAVTISYWLAGLLHANDLLLLAPTTTLLVIQGSPLATLGSSVQRILGTCAGVALATVWVENVPGSTVSFAVAILGALSFARLLPVGLTGQMQVATGALYVLVVGNPSNESGFWRVGDVIIGGLVGMAAVLLFPPRSRVLPAQEAIEALREAQAEQLRRIGAEIGSLTDPLTPPQRHAFDESSLALATLEEAARSELSAAADSLRFRVRTHEAWETIRLLRAEMARLAGLTAQIRAIGGAADRLYDRETVDPALAPDVARGLLLACADLITSSRAESDATAALADEMQDRFDRALSETTSGGISVTRVLESVSLLGRIELLVETLRSPQPA